MADMTLSLAQIAEMGGSFRAVGFPRLMLPSDISAVVGDTLQVFTRGVIEYPDPYALPQKWTSTVGSTFPRFWEFTPAGGDVGSHVLTVTVTDDDQANIVSASTNVTVKAAADPGSLKTIMCVGDSLTSSMAWPEEVYRRLTQSGGSPAGHGFANFDFAGANAFPNFGTQGGFGNSGWTWGNYTGASSPFWIGGQFDIKAWFDANNGGVGPDLAIILLGWNSVTNSSTASGYSSTVTAAKVFLDKLHAQYPSCKVTLLGLQVPSPNGGLGTNYGATGTYSQYYDLLRYSYGMNLALKSIADEAGYSSWVRFAATAAQFDAEYGYPTSSTAVNVRSATTETRQTNGIHPTTSGTLQIADVAYREVVRWLS
jgi:hypothetical protein